MNGIRVLALSLCAAVLVLAAVGAAPRSARVARGKYLTSIIGCNDCHTPGSFYGAPDFKRRLSGSEMGWAGPWGVVYAANLTPDRETGLGAWTEDQIVTALRTGIRPDGRQLAPAMPWMDFAAMTDADAHAIGAYLKTLPPIQHKVPTPVPPGQQAQGPVLTFPPPSAWDAPGPPSGK